MRSRMTAVGCGAILRWLRGVLRATVLVGLAFVAATCTTGDAPPSVGPIASAIATSGPPASAPIITRLSIPRQTDALRLKVAPDHRHVLAIGGDIATFFDLSGNTLATVDERTTGLTWVAWLPNGSGAIFANAPRAPQPLALSVIRWGQPRIDLGRAVAPDIGGPPLSPDGNWIALFIDCCSQHIVAFRLDGSDRREIVSSTAPVSLLGWDALSRVLVQSGNEIVGVSLDGTRISMDVGLRNGVHAKWASLMDQSPDRRVAFLLISADRPLSDTFNGFGALALIDDSVSEPARPA